MKKILSLLFIIISQSIFSSTYNVAKGNVEFVAKGFPSFIKINGVSTKVDGTLKKDKDLLSGTFKLDLSSLSTGMELRDDHMKNKYLEVGKYPTAILTLTPFKLEDSGTAKGVLKLHNVEKEIEIEYESSQNQNSISVETKLNLVLNDFQIAIPSFQGITVAKDIAITVNLKANKE